MDLREKAPEVAALEEGNWKFDLQLFADEETVTIPGAAGAETEVTDDFTDDDGHEINIGEKQALFDETMQAESADEGEESASKEVPDQVKREQSPEANAAFAEMRRKAQEAERALKERDSWVEQNFGQTHGLKTWEQYQAAVEQTHRQEQVARQQEMQQRPQQVYQQTYQQLIEQGYDQQVAQRLASNEANNVAHALEVWAMKEKLAMLERQDQEKVRQQQQEAITAQILADHQYLRGKYSELVPDIQDMDANTIALIKQGIPLKAAWLAANEDAIVDYARGKGAQKATREINSKAHLDSEKGGGSGIGKQVHVSAEKLQVWRALGYSDKEARQKEARYQRQKRG